MEIVKVTKLRKAAETITIILLAAIASAFLPAHAQQKGKIGDLVTFKDGSKGVLVQVDRSGESGWAVALQDAGTARWAKESWDKDTKALNKSVPEKRSLNDIHELLADTAGYAATEAIRKAANGDANRYPAAFAVEFDNGWFLPTAGQMFSLFAMEPFIKKTIEENGGKLPEGNYWTSTPKDQRTAWFLHCQLGISDDKDDGGKTKTLFVRAMHRWRADENVETITFTLAFNGNGATEGTMQSMSVTVGASITLPTNTFKREGYEFLGWNRVQGAAAPAYTDGQADVALQGKSNETITLYAVWKKLPSTAVESITLASAQIVSNPFEEQLTVVGTETAIRVEVYSILGTQLYSASLHGEEKLEIATGEWSSGVYLIKLEATDGIKVIRAVKR